MTKGDWRLQGQEAWLLEKSLREQKYRCSAAGWAHDHCECGGRKSSLLDLDGLTSGYATPDSRWVFETCFVNFCGHFRWKLAEG
jgi:hypothetical protein